MLAVKNDGTVWAWGSNSKGQLGNGVIDNPPLVPTPQQVGGIGNVVAVAGGGDFSLALKGDGTVWAWGNDYEGALGTGTAGNPNERTFATPQQTVGLTNVVAIAASRLNSFALRNDGTVWIWGYFCDTLANKPESGFHDCPSPQRVPELAGITAIAASSNYVLALRSDGVVLSWGNNLVGQLGRPEGFRTNDAQQHVGAVTGLGGVVAIAAGNGHSVALKGDGTVWAWGYNKTHQLGNGIADDSIPWNVTPGQVVGLTNVAKIAVGVDSDHTLALKHDGTVYAWGRSGNGQIGSGDAAVNAVTVATPQRVTGLSGVTTIGATQYASVAIGTYTAIPSFGDVPVGYWAYTQIGTFAQRGITTGCDVGLYCPERSVTRAEMAVFVDRTLGYGTPATPVSQAFSDVPTNYWAYAYIDQFAKLGVTTGCGGTEFCPDRGVTRAEMAAFLIRALKQAQVTPATPTFADVPASHPQFGYIEALVKLGVTTGCGTNDAGQRVYCPDRGVTRAEMAVFIVRAFP